MYVAQLDLTDFRSYPTLTLDLPPGVVALVGPNGRGKTNIVEAIGYLATLASHRVSGDAPLIRLGSDRAIIRALLAHGDRTVALAVEIAAGRTAPPMVNGVSQRRRSDLVGILRCVGFAPEDLALVKGDPDVRRRYLDSLLVQLNPRIAGDLADYDRVTRQRASLLKSLGAVQRSGRSTDTGTLDVWDTHLAQYGARIIVARQDLVVELNPHVVAAYSDLAGSGPAASLSYAPSVDGVVPPDQEESNADRSKRLVALEGRFLEAIAKLRPKEIERGINLVGPHRDDLKLGIGDLPARGYASHGESWSLALALKMGAFGALDVEERGSAVLILDDVFAELDAARRKALATMVAEADQVIVTAAVSADIPPELEATRYNVAGGGVQRVC